MVGYDILSIYYQYEIRNISASQGLYQTILKPSIMRKGAVFREKGLNTGPEREMETDLPYCYKGFRPHIKLLQPAERVSKHDVDLNGYKHTYTVR